MTDQKPWRSTDPEDDEPGIDASDAFDVEEHEGAMEGDPESEPDVDEEDYIDHIETAKARFEREGQPYEPIIAAEGTPDDQASFRRVSEEADMEEARAKAEVNEVAEAPTITELPSAPSSPLESVRALPHKPTEIPEEFQRILECDPIQDFFRTVTLTDFEHPEQLTLRLSRALSTPEARSILHFLEGEADLSFSPDQQERLVNENIERIATMVVEDLRAKAEQYLRSEVSRQQTTDTSIKTTTVNAGKRFGASMLGGFSYMSLLRLAQTGLRWVPLPHAYLTSIAASTLAGGLNAVVMAKFPKLVKKTVDPRDPFQSLLDDVDQLPSRDLVGQRVLLELQTDFAFLMDGEERRATLTNQTLEDLNAMEAEDWKRAFGSSETNGGEKVAKLRRVIEATANKHRLTPEQARERRTLLKELLDNGTMSRFLLDQAMEKVRSMEVDEMDPLSRRSFELELMLRLEEKMNALMGDLSIDDADLSSSRQRSAAESYWAMLTGTMPPESIAQIFLRGCSQGMVSGIAHGNAYAGAIYMAARTGMQSFQQEMLGVTAKERSIRTATELQNQGRRLLEEIQRDVEVPWDGIRSWRVEVRARMKLPGLREVDRSRLEHQLRSIQYAWEAHRVFGEEEAKTGREFVNLLSQRIYLRKEDVARAQTSAETIAEQTSKAKTYRSLLAAARKLSWLELGRMGVRMAPKMTLALAGGLAGGAAADTCLGALGFSEASAAVLPGRPESEPSAPGDTLDVDDALVSDVDDRGGSVAGAEEVTPGASDGSGSPGGELLDAATETEETPHPIYEEKGYHWEKHGDAPYELTLDLKSEGSVHQLEQAYSQLAAQRFELDKLIQDDALTELGAAKLLNVAGNLVELTEGRGLSSLQESFAEAGVTVEDGVLTIKNMTAFDQVMRALVDRANQQEAALLHGSVASINNYSNETWKEILSLGLAIEHRGGVQIPDFDHSATVLRAEQEVGQAQLRSAFGDAVEPEAIHVDDENNATIVIGGQEVRVENGKIVAIGDATGFSIDLASNGSPEALQSAMFDAQVQDLAGANASAEQVASLQDLACELHGEKGVLSPHEQRVVEVLEGSEVSLDAVRHGESSVDMSLVHLVEEYPDLTDAKVTEVADGRDVLREQVTVVMSPEFVYELVVDNDLKIHPIEGERGVWIVDSHNEEGVKLLRDDGELVAQFAPELNPGNLDSAETLQSPITGGALQQSMDDVSVRDLHRASELLTQREHAEQEALHGMNAQREDSGAFAFFKRDMQPEDLDHLFKDVTVNEFETLSLKELGEKIGTNQTDDLGEVSGVVRNVLSNDVAKDLPLGQALSESIAHRVEAGTEHSAAHSVVHSESGSTVNEESSTGPIDQNPPAIENEMPLSEGGSEPTRENPPAAENESESPSKTG